MWEGRLGGISFMMMMRKRPWPLTIVVHTPGRGGPYALTCAVVISQRSQEKSDWIQKRRSTTLERGEIEVRRSSHGPALIKTVLTLVLLFKHRGQLALGLIDPHVHIFCHILQCLAGWHIPNTRAIHTLDQSLPHKWHQQLPNAVNVLLPVPPPEVPQAAYQKPLPEKRQEHSRGHPAKRPVPRDGGH